MAFRLDEITSRLGGRLLGDGALQVTQVATLENARPDQIGFLASPKYKTQLKTTRAGAVILVEQASTDFAGNKIVADNPYVYFARVAQLLNPPPRTVAGAHAQAVVQSSLDPSVSVGPGASIGSEVLVGENTQIGAGCRIGDNVRIGANSLLHAGVTIYPGCNIGDRVIIHSGTVIGADGFGFAHDADGAWIKIPQIGRAIIGNDVEIGANTTIDRGALDDTVIEDGVKLDNQIQVAHNVRIGAHTAIAGCVGIAGSAIIGSRCMIGGAAMIHGHLQIADGVTVSAATLVTKSITRAGTYTGNVPFMEHAEWRKNLARLRHLDALADKIHTLEARLTELEKKT